MLESETLFYSKSPSSSQFSSYKVNSWKSLPSSLQNGVFLVFIENVTSVDDAILLRGIDWFVPRQQLSNESLIEDYIGLLAVDQISGKNLGKISSYVVAGGKDYFSIKTTKGSFLLPCEKQYWESPKEGIAVFIDSQGWILGAAAYIDS